MITPAEIRAKAVRAYPRMLVAWLQDEQLASFFPLPVRANLSPIHNNVPATIAAVEALRSNSKEECGRGYTIHWEERRSRDFGLNWFPGRIAIDTLDDLLRLADCQRQFADTRRVVVRLREEFPNLSGWLASNIRTVCRLAGAMEGLIEVTRFFLNNPWSECYARQIPAAVDTKFVERNQALLRAWLDTLLPASAIQAGETRFELRFGLRDAQPHTAVRTLDRDLQAELRLPFDELSVPLRALATLPVRDATVFIVENQLNLLTLPSFKRGIAIRGEGKAVTRLRRVEWLCDNHIVYWGDIDVEGFQILASLRSLFPRDSVGSIMMDPETLRLHSALIVEGNAIAIAVPPHLEAVSKLGFQLGTSSGAEDCCGQLVKGLEVLSAPFIAQLEPTEVAEPAERAFDNVARLAEAAAVGTRFSQRGQDRFDAQPLHEVSQSGRTVAGIALQSLGFGARSASRSRDGRHVDDERQRDLVVARISRRGFDHQRNARCVGQHMPLTAGFCTVRRVWSGVRPPKTARTLALSITARSRLTAPALPSCERSSLCSFDQTASSVHSENRRQQVLPLPQSISIGKDCHGMPVLSTNTTPVNAWRLLTRGRPPKGEGSGSGGRSGATCSHNSSDTSSAMRRPPCSTRRRNTTDSTQVLK
jgi:hypothetical protein